MSPSEPQLTFFSPPQTPLVSLVVVVAELVEADRSGVALETPEMEKLSGVGRFGIEGGDKYVLIHGAVHFVDGELPDELLGAATSSP